MTTSDNYQAFVWVWLPGEIAPVVAGKLEEDNGGILFNYGRSYLARMEDTPKAIPLYEPELPLQPGKLSLLPGLHIPSCIRDAAPDAWGRRVIINKLFGFKGKNADTSVLNELTYLLESGSDRIGAFDFQSSPDEYIPRIAHYATLEELLESAQRVEDGIPLSPELDQALFHGSSIGGARPKALIEDFEHKYIAKFSSSTDIFSVVKAEFIAMRLAAIAGLSVAPVRLTKVLAKDVLLIERFDRLRVAEGWTRMIMVSALTLFGMHDMVARYASYTDFAEIIRYRFVQPGEALRELFSRLVFNILCGNTDDHARNHAAFWDGSMLRLTPAYDICPQFRAGNEASQAMRIKGENNFSQLSICLDVAHHFQLSRSEAAMICEYLESVIRDNWEKVCEEAVLSEIDRKILWGRIFLNPFAFSS